jgi:hypothetical protein
LTFWHREALWWGRKKREYAYRGPMIIDGAVMTLPCHWYQPCWANNDG